MNKVFNWENLVLTSKIGLAFLIAFAIVMGAKVATPKTSNIPYSATGPKGHICKLSGVCNPHGHTHEGRKAWAAAQLKKG
jgi:hypothetical protein